MNKLLKNSKRGFTIFFAVLVASLALSIGLSIFDLTIRELDLSQTATQSQFAIYAADTGAECVLYWDFHYSGNWSGSAFATSTDYTGASSGSNLTCNSLDITDPDSSDAAYTNSERTATAATTTFTLKFSTQNKPYCARITVAKVGNPPQTTVTSRGYNTCEAGAILQLERSLQLNY